MRATALIVLVIYILKILISSVVLDSSAFLQRTVVVNHDALREKLREFRGRHDRMKIRKEAEEKDQTY